MNTDESKLREVLSPIVKALGHASAKNLVHEIHTSLAGWSSLINQPDDLMVSIRKVSDKEAILSHTSD